MPQKSFQGKRRSQEAGVFVFHQPLDCQLTIDGCDDNAAAARFEGAVNNQDVIGTLANGAGPLAGMGGKTVYININGDPSVVYEVVKRVLRDTGYSEMRSYGS